MRRFPSFSHAIEYACEALLAYGEEVDAGHWQGISTEGKPDLITLELMNFGFTCPLPDSLLHLRAEIAPNLPWADEEFVERVGGEPHNPHESLPSWPWWRGQTEATMVGGEFSHTYSERFWPKYAGNFSGYERVHPKKGLRYEMGDFNDLVNLLRREPHTRQAYLPIFFPEDTGAAHGGRIPCTLGYHFMLRNDHLHMWYFLRSCDYVRHFRDDLYMAARLVYHILGQLGTETMEDVNADFAWHDVRPGNFTFICPSLHVHKGDAHLVRP